MTERFLRRALEDEEIWVDIEGGDFYTLNATAARILALMRDGVTDGVAIAARLTAEYHVPPDEAAAAVGSLVKEAESYGMVSHGSGNS